MGTFFDNLHVLKNNKFDFGVLKNELSIILSDKGYTYMPESSEGDVSIVIYEPEDGAWVSIASDVFLFDTEKAIRDFADPISEALNTYVIAASCYDSDYLRLALLNKNANVDGWINVGKSLDPLIRRTKLTPWNELIKDSEQLKEIVKNDYTYKEEAFLSIAELIGMKPEQSLFVDNAFDSANGKIVKLFFSAPEGKTNPPKFCVLAHFKNQCDTGLRVSVTISNKGCKSKGIGLMIISDFIENDEVVFEEVKLGIFDGLSYKNVPIKLKKGRLNDGKTCLFWLDDDFAILPSVNENLPLKKRIELEFKRAFMVKFIIKGNPDKFVNSRLVVYPKHNSLDGQVSWFYKNDIIPNV